MPTSPTTLTACLVVDALLVIAHQWLLVALVAALGAVATLRVGALGRCNPFPLRLLLRTSAFAALCRLSHLIQQIALLRSKLLARFAIQASARCATQPLAIFNLLAVFCCKH